MIDAVRILTIITLILVFNLFYLETVLAEITIDEGSNAIHVETNNYQVRFAPNAITYLHNKLTDETYTLPLEQTYEIQAAILGRNEDFYASRGTVETSKINDNTAEVRFQKGGNEITLTIAIEPNTEDLLITLNGVAETPGISAIQWAIDNLNLANLKLITPSQNLPLLDVTSAITRRLFFYPTASWEAQLAIIEAQHGGFYVRSTDPTFKFKNMYYRRYTDKFGLNFMTQNQAPWDTLTTAKSVTWRLNTYVGDWCVPAQMYRDWMEGTFDPWRLSDVPPWVSDISLVVVNDSLNTEILKPLAESVDPTKTLLYLTDWRKAGRDSGYRNAYHPDYTPHEKFDVFLEVARQHGFRVMPHVNLYDCTVSHPLYPEFKKYQYRRPETGELSGWFWDKIGHPERSAHISLASSEWRNLLIQQWKALWEKYNIDAFHLDVSHYVLNDANGLIEGLTSAEANILMHKQLAKAMPGVVFSGEFIHELTFFRESFAKRSLTLGPRHPISTFLFSPYTRFHFGGPIPVPQNPELQLFVNFGESQGYLHTLRINKTEMLNEPLAQDTLSVVRQWQALGLRPDLGCDWGSNTLFQYTVQTGETVTYQRTDSGAVLVLPNDGGHERVFGTTQVQTHRSLPHWRAYNETALLGLDPNKYYFLGNTPRDFSQLHINSLSSDVYISETRITDQAALFQLESTSSNRHTDIGFYLPTTPIGSFPDTLRHIGSGRYTLKADLSKPVVIFLGPVQQVSLPYDLKEVQFTTGSQLNDIFQINGFLDAGSRRTATIDNIRKEGIFAHPPTYGQTILQFPLFVVQEPSTFSFSTGLVKGCSNGVLFQVLLNGQVHSEIFKDTFDWTNGSISLSQFTGQPLLLELVTDPAEESGAICDWAFWADLRITAAPNPDTNLDGRINVLDLITVAQSLGQQPPSNPLADTNKDGAVNILDLVFVAEHLSQNAAAPSQLDLIKSIPSTAKEVIAAQRALIELEAMPNKSHGVQIAIELLRHYLSIADRNVQETKLLPNYPNPFNPDTWIPYQLSEGSTVTVKIYDVTGSLVRTIEVGHKPVGYYLTREQTVYWDGRNQNGESISSGVYFYTLITDHYTQTRRMVIVK